MAVAAPSVVGRLVAGALENRLLAELLLITGEAEKADRMLDAAALHEPNPAVLEFRKLLRAEVTLEVTVL